MKKFKQQPEWKLLGFDSAEEWYFSWWLDELKEAGFVIKYERQKPTFTLSEKIEKTVVKQHKTKKKEVKQTLFQECTYTPDFTIEFTIKALLLFIDNLNWITTKAELLYNWRECDKIKDNIWTVYADVKPLFTLEHSKAQVFSIIQKWMYQKHEIYVNKVIYQKLFEKTFTPKKYLLTEKTKQPRKIKWEVRTLQEFVNEK